jgi:hypothetical protein
MTGVELKLFFTAVFVALGVTAPVPDFIAGLFIAIGCANGVMIKIDKQTRLSFFTTTFLAVLAATLTAILHKHLWFVHAWPLQAVMAIAGGFSSFVVEWIIAAGAAGKDRARDAVNNIKLPWEKTDD